MSSVDLAVSLVNAIVPGESRGRGYPAADGVEELRGRAQAVPGLTPGRPLTDKETRGVAKIAEELHAVFASAHDGDIDAAARLLNAMIVRYDARPTLLRHDNEPWHLHFHGPGAGVVEGIGGATSVALAFVFGGEYADRVGMCSAPNCDRVYVDVSRNGTKRYCSTACQNRVKAASFRARQAGSEKLSAD
ncbi:CGNR zinc finger domain-containing protein [Actinocrinis sp.]|uniref:CGNR zinc finger domain-containing protein n=1 Tax=Actinocrinis sp. TaxID=1920516 RepID=UPI002D24AB1C|nr:CGNR zinc finger domain-containing protein [Actinocrinis sp.]HZP53390.1 CGNR zinc finger domain-containing protein [Actinocrinis sp.]